MRCSLQLENKKRRSERRQKFKKIRVGGLVRGKKKKSVRAGRRERLHIHKKQQKMRMFKRESEVIGGSGGKLRDFGFDVGRG